MSLIEDLSNPLSRLIVYLCLSLIGLKKGLLPWSIQRGEKSNHFSLCLSFFVSVFLFSFFFVAAFFCSWCLFLCLLFFVFSRSSYPSPHISARLRSLCASFILALFLSSKLIFFHSFLYLSSYPSFFSTPCLFLYFFLGFPLLYLLYTSDRLQQAIHQVRNG